MTKFELVVLEDIHVMNIIERNKIEGFKIISPSVNINELLGAYLSKGSIGYTLLADDVPVGCAGIINLNWQRGEAWLLISSLFFQYKKTCLKIIKRMLILMVKTMKLKRVQSCINVEFNEGCLFMEHLGLKWKEF